MGLVERDNKEEVVYSISLWCLSTLSMSIVHEYLLMSTEKVGWGGQRRYDTTDLFLCQPTLRSPIITTIN